MPPSDPRFLSLTSEQMLLDLAMDGYLFHGGDKELWFEEELEQDLEEGAAETVPAQEYTDEDRKKALERLKELGAIPSVAAGLESGEFFIEEEGVEYAAGDDDE